MISVNNLQKRSKNKEIIHDFSFTFLSNNVYRITGMNGEGKSTLLKCISGIIEIDSGTIAYDGYLIKKENKSIIRSDYVCYIDQSIDLISSLSIRENLLLESRLLGYSPDLNELSRLIEVFTLMNRLDTKIKYLSGGQKKAVSFIKGLLSNKPVVIYDETLASMDRKHKDIAINLIIDNQKKKLIIISTNEPIEVGIAVDLNETKTSINVSTSDYVHSTTPRQPMLKYTLFTQSFFLMILLFSLFISVTMLSMAIHSYNQGSHIYQAYDSKNNSHLLINNSNMNEISVNELNKMSIYNLLNSNINISEHTANITISFTNKNHRNEVNIIDHLAEQFSLQVNDTITINNEVFIVKEVYESLDQMIEPEIFFSDNYDITGLTIHNYFSIYRPNESEFKFIYREGIFYGLIFNGDDEILSPINQLKVYEIGIDITVLFLGISSIVIGYMFTKNNRSSLYRFLYVISNIGLNEKTINRYSSKHLLVIFTTSFIFGFMGLMGFINSLNSHFINQYGLSIDLIKVSFASVIIPMVVWFIIYAITSHIKNKVTNFY